MVHMAATAWSAGAYGRTAIRVPQRKAGGVPRHRGASLARPLLGDVRSASEARMGHLGERSPAACGAVRMTVRYREALAEALDLLDDTSRGLVHDGQQAWQDAYGRIHDAAGKPQRDETTTRPW